MLCKTLKKCRICYKKNFYYYLDLGFHPLANSFLRKEEINKEKKFPLKIGLCINCKLSQLSVVISSRKIFNDYDYLSSSSKALKEHYKELVKFLMKKYPINKGDSVLDIGCNDGVLLTNYKFKKINLLGVEPSNASNFIKDDRIILYRSFFNKEIADKILQRFGKVKIITMTNVLAHVDNINNLITNVRNIIHKDGIFVVEVPYIYNMLKNGTYDVIYHEHLSYFSLSSLIFLFEKNKMKIVDVKKIDFGASGPSIRVIVSLDTNFSNLHKNLKNFLNKEKKLGMDKFVIYNKFKNKVFKKIKKLKSIINYYENNNIKLACYTAPAKGNTLLNSLNITNKFIKYVSENNKKKIDKYTPGTHLKIVKDSFLKKKKIKHAILLSWNYKKFFLKKSKFILNGGRFIIPF